MIPMLLIRGRLFFFFFFNDTATTEIYTLSLHDALPICLRKYVRSPHGVLGCERFEIEDFYDDVVALLGGSAEEQPTDFLTTPRSWFGFPQSNSEPVHNIEAEADTDTLTGNLPDVRRGGNKWLHDKRSQFSEFGSSVQS